MRPSLAARCALQAGLLGLALAGCEGLAPPWGAGGGPGGGGGLGGGGAAGGGAGGGQAGGGGGTGGGQGGGGGGASAAGFTPGPPGCQPLTVEAGVSLGGYRSDRYGWSDAACRPRSAALVRNDAADPGGSNGGYLRVFTYQPTPGVVRTATGTGSNGWNGWGYVVNHFGGGADLSSDHTGTYRTVLAGAHHAVHEFKVRMQPGGPVDVTVRWFFATGRSAPVYAISFDASPAGANAVTADSRAPYGDLAFEGTAGDIGGVGWGDQYKFTTLGAGPVSGATGWDYTAPNTVPYVRMWSSAVDAEMGAVQTQTFARRIAGGDYGAGLLATDCQGRTSATQGAGCRGTGWTMPTDWLWPFQLNQYELPFGTTSHRLAWGLSYGAVGQTSVQAFGRTFSGYPTLAYAVALVLGPRSAEATLAEVTAMERRLAAAVSAGAWVEAFAGWELPAGAGGTTFTLTPAGGPVAAPLFHLTGFAPAAPSQVSVGGAPLAAGEGYFASRDPADGSLWLTLNGTVSAAVVVRVE